MNIAAVPLSARNWTAAFASDGRPFVWGRMDKNQLGLGLGRRKPKSAARRIILKASKGPKSLELPDDNNVDTPTPIPLVGIDTSTLEASPSRVEEENRLAERLKECGQQPLNAVSRFLVRAPVVHWLAVRVHLMAGDLVHAVETLVDWWGRHSVTKERDSVGEVLGRMLDSIWTLLPLYPTREIRQLVLLMLLMANVPIHDRFASDLRFVKLMESFFDGLIPPLKSHTTRQTYQSRRRLSEYTQAERESIVKLISQKRSEQLRQKYSTFRQRCEQPLKSSSQLRFYSNCRHYERCIVESGPNRVDIIEAKNRMRKCTRCVIRDRQQKQAPRRSLLHDSG